MSPQLNIHPLLFILLPSHPHACGIYRINLLINSFSLGLLNSTDNGYSTTTMNVCECGLCVPSLLCPGIATRRIQHAGLTARTCSGGNLAVVVVVLKLCPLTCLLRSPFSQSFVHLGTYSLLVYCMVIIVVPPTPIPLSFVTYHKSH